MSMKVIRAHTGSPSLRENRSIPELRHGKDRPILKLSFTVASVFTMSSTSFCSSSDSEEQIDVSVSESETVNLDVNEEQIYLLLRQ